MTRALLVLALAAACGDKKPSPPPAALPTKPATPAPPAAPTIVPATTRQLVTAIVDDWTSTKATLRLWTRTSHGWMPAGEPWPAVVGHAGTGWGIGLHGIGAPNREGPLKKEGDGKSPAGAFAIRSTAYGVADDAPPKTKLAYETTKLGDWECVHDPGSAHYASIVDRKQVPSDWESAEQMLRDDDLYKWVIDIAHNPERTPGKGSCIFLHLWGGKDSSTIGCTAMDEKRMLELLATLDPAANPVFVLLPKADYAALAAGWGLPPH